MARAWVPLGLLPLCSAALASEDVLSAVQGVVRVHGHGHGADECADIHEQENLSGRLKERLDGLEDSEVLEAGLAKSAEIVVVRGAGEDVRWLDALPEIPAVVYNRNGLPELLPKERKNLRIVAQDNVGREDDAILRHIVHNYDRLAPTTLFLQGWPFWHCAGTLEMVRRAVKNAHEPVDPDFIANGAQSGLVPLAGSFFQYSLPDASLGSWFNLVQADRRKLKMNYEEATEHARKSYSETCASILDGPCPSTHWVSEGSQWAVSSSRIHQHSWAFYQRLLDLNTPGLDSRKKRLRGLVLEAMWPQLWGAPGWTPGDAVKMGRPGKHTASAKRTDALGNYCIYSSDKGAFPSLGERRGVCELDRHASGLQTGALAMQSLSAPWSMRGDLRPIMNYALTFDALTLGSRAAKIQRPKKLYSVDDRSPFCSKRHIWSIPLITRIKNKDSGKCVQLDKGGFAAAPCEEEAEVQQWQFIANGNGGFYQVQDKRETACISHIWGRSDNKCRIGPDGGPEETQLWDLLKLGESEYHIKVKGGSNCMVHTYQGFETGDCHGPGAVWQLDAADMGQYYDKFEFSFVAAMDGKLKLRCSVRLHSSKPEAASDLVQPDWRRKGRLVTWNIVDAPEGGFYLSQHGVSAERYLGCEDSTGEAVVSEKKVPWKIRPVSNGFVFLETEAKALQFVTEGGHLRCAALDRSAAAPPQDTVFALDLQEQPARIF